MHAYKREREVAIKNKNKKMGQLECYLTTLANLDIMPAVPGMESECSISNKATNKQTNKQVKL